MGRATFQHAGREAGAQRGSGAFLGPQDEEVSGWESQGGLSGCKLHLCLSSQSPATQSGAQGHPFPKHQVTHPSARLLIRSFPVTCPFPFGRGDAVRSSALAR